MRTDPGSESRYAGSPIDRLIGGPPAVEESLMFRTRGSRKKLMVGTLMQAPLVALGMLCGAQSVEAEPPPLLTLSWSATGSQNANFGGSVAGVDVNGDGYGDVVVGARYFANGQAEEGGIFVYLGSASGLGGAPAWTAEGNARWAHLGDGVTGGDVNGDGVSDIIAVSPEYGAGMPGSAFAWHGSAAGLGPNGTPANADWTALGDAAFGFRGVATAGDVNGDGYDDVIFGNSAYFADGHCGRVIVYQGSATGLAASPAWVMDGSHVECSQHGIGNSVATAGDVNGDGYSDVVIGDFFYSTGELEGAGGHSSITALPQVLLARRPGSEWATNPTSISDCPWQLAAT